MLLPRCGGTECTVRRRKEEEEEVKELERRYRRGEKKWAEKRGERERKR